MTPELRRNLERIKRRNRRLLQSSYGSERERTEARRLVELVDRMIAKAEIDELYQELGNPVG